MLQSGPIPTPVELGTVAIEDTSTGSARNLTSQTAQMRRRNTKDPAKARPDSCRYDKGMIDDLDDLVRSAVSEIFDTMLNLGIRGETPGAEITNGEPHVAGSVGFSGVVSGVVYIYSSVTLAKLITAGLLGLEPAEVSGDEMVNDAVGELANMVVGQLKSRLCDRGISCVLTVPSIVRGTNFTIEAVSSTSRRVLMFRCDNNQQLVVEVLVRTPSNRTA
jgi:chemotaxis protein CheX